MELNPGQLAALVAIADEGSFEAAARRLRLTPSAVSQRIRALETAAGRVLVSRTQPCQLTEPGAELAKLGRQTDLLLTQARTVLGEDAAAELAVAVNADSLATWLRPALTEIAQWETPVALRLTIEDQDHSHQMLRSGQALAAIASDPQPVQGCSVTRLGTLRYLSVATPAFADRWRRGNRLDWARMPVVVFNAKDRLQHRQLTARGIESPAVVHQVPASTDFCAAVEAGLGWAMLPEPQAEAALSRGDLVRLGRDRLDVALYWQRWRLDSPLLDRLTEVVRTAALAGLRP